VIGRHQAGHRRRLRRREEQRGDLEHQRGEHEAEQRVDERQRGHDEGPGDRGDHHHLLAVHPVDQHAGAGGEEEARSDPGRHHDADGGAARAGADAVGQGDDGEEAQPVTQGGDDLGQPEPEEDLRAEHPHVQAGAVVRLAEGAKRMGDDLGGIVVLAVLHGRPP
jgi:hypothetical protein